MQRSGHRDLGEVLRDEMVMKDRIIDLLRQGPKTIPEIAEALGSPTHETLYWVMALWRYGSLVDSGDPNDEGYYRYQLSE